METNEEEISKVAEERRQEDEEGIQADEATSEKEDEAFKKK